MKIQLFGRRRTFSLGTGDRTQAAAQACRIYQTIQTQGWEAAGQRGSATNLGPQSLNAGPALAPEFDVEHWKGRLIHRKYPEPPNREMPAELSAHIEHAGISRYFPLGTNDETKAAAQAMRIHQTVLQEGWAVANQRFRRELTLAMRWLDDPLAWTYVTLHAQTDDPTLTARPSRGHLAVRQTAVIEPDGPLRLALANAIKSNEGFHCCAVYGGVAEAEREVTRRSFDFVLINYLLPDRSGANGLEQLQKLKRGLVGLLYSVYEDSDELFKTTPGGATGYMLKRTPAHRIFEPISDIRGTLTDELMAACIRDYFQRLVAAMPSGLSALEMARLTPREHEILSLLAKGGVAKEIADFLGISVWTVHGHIKSIFEKLGVHTRTEAVVKFLQK